MIFRSQRSTRGNTVLNMTTRVNTTGVAMVIVGAWLLCLAGCGGGCASTEQTTYRSTGVAVVTVDAAMKAWGDYVAKTHPGAATEKKVADAYAKYTQSVNLVADAAIAFQKSKAANDPALPEAQAVFNNAIAASASALMNLQELIISFGVKLR
jgi:hypothetical protein